MHTRYVCLTAGETYHPSTVQNEEIPSRFEGRGIPLKQCLADILTQ